MSRQSSIRPQSDPSSLYRLARIPPIFASRSLVAQLVLAFSILSVNGDNSPSVQLAPINPPPVQCQPFKFSWVGGIPPFYVILTENLGGGTRELGPTNDYSFLWDVDFPAGSQLFAMVSSTPNSKGPFLSQVSGPFTVQPGVDSFCLGNPSSVSSSSPIPVASSIGAITTTLGPRSLVVSPPSPTGGTLSYNSEFTFVTETSLQQGYTSLATTISIPGSGVVTTTVYTAIQTVLFTSTQEALPFTSGGSRGEGSVGKGGIAGIIIGCLATAALAALALIMCRKRRGSEQRARILSVSTLSTEPFRAATWSDLIPPRRGQHAEEYSTTPIAGSSSGTVDDIQIGNTILNRDVRSEKATLQQANVWQETPFMVELEGGLEEIGRVDGENRTEDTASGVPSSAPPSYNEDECPSYRY